ncbi:ABC transporter permease [Microbacterium resistens]|uniref:ABC transporter permease n=1 Tax=Microbacterium resistens TaxID=156977 RepID=UPI001C57FE56|nr:ABC transporter permease [Microbacterium resistens]MBW1637560.1 ABC transporter permease [Microbacterium resistens]
MSAATLPAVRNTSRFALVRRRFLRHPLALVGGVMLVILLLIAYVLPLLLPYRPADLDPDLAQSLVGPNPRHWFGTDQIGHDLLAQCVSGLQKSLLIGFVAALASTGIAALVGSIAGYFGGWSDRVITVVIDLLLVLPSFLIVAIISPAIQGVSFVLLALVIAAFNWMITARVVRGLAIALRDREYVESARYMGVGADTIIRTHLLPNMASLLIVDATLNVGGAILAETGLSYFGFGIQAPDVSLGTLIAVGTSGPSLTSSPWLWLFPGALIVATVLSVNFLGDAMRDAIDANSTRGARR